MCKSDPYKAAKYSIESYVKVGTQENIPGSLKK